MLKTSEKRTKRFIRSVVAKDSKWLLSCVTMVTQSADQKMDNYKMAAGKSECDKEDIKLLEKCPKDSLSKVC